MTAELETLIDRYMERVELPPKFVIPGGTQLSAQLDLARAILRRAERRAVALDGGDGVLSAEPAHLPQPRVRRRLRARSRRDADEPELFAGREREQPKA